jgi:hypothetical protein
MFLGRSRQVKKNSYDKNSGEIPAEYIILSNQLLAETYPGRSLQAKKKLDVKIKHL